MDKQLVVYSHNEILLSNKKKWTIATGNGIGKSRRRYAEWKKPRRDEQTNTNSIIQVHAAQENTKVIHGEKHPKGGSAVEWVGYLGK